MNNLSYTINTENLSQATQDLSTLDFAQIKMPFYYDLSTGDNWLTRLHDISEALSEGSQVTAGELLTACGITEYTPDVRVRLAKNVWSLYLVYINNLILGGQL